MTHRNGSPNGAPHAPPKPESRPDISAEANRHQIIISMDVATGRVEVQGTKTDGVTFLGMLSYAEHMVSASLQRVPPNTSPIVRPPPGMRLY